MEYLSVTEAKHTNGLRLALSQGVPGPWGESAKAVFRLRQVPFTAVSQLGGSDNPELVEWTGHRNAPIAMYNNEAPRVRWLEIVELAERLGSGPSLLPATIDERVRMVGLTNEIAGESGLAWFGRVLMLQRGHQAQGDKVLNTPMYLEYGYSEANAAIAAERIKAILAALNEQVLAQRGLGSPYFVGNQLSALDVYWAYFSQLVDTYPAEKNPLPDFLRATWAVVKQTCGEAPPALLKQRDYVFEHHLELPMSF